MLSNLTHALAVNVDRVSAGPVEVGVGFISEVWNGEKHILAPRAFSQLAPLGASREYIYRGESTLEKWCATYCLGEACLFRP